MGNTCPLVVPNVLEDRAGACRELATLAVTDQTRQCASLLDGGCSSPFVCAVPAGSEQTPAEVYQTRTASCCETFREMNDALCFCQNSETILNATLGDPIADKARYELFMRLTQLDADFADLVCGFNIDQERAECVESLVEELGVGSGGGGGCAALAQGFGDEGCAALVDGRCTDPISCGDFVRLTNSCCPLLTAVSESRCLCGGGALRNSTLVDAATARAIELAVGSTSQAPSFVEAVCGVAPVPC